MDPRNMKTEVTKYVDRTPNFVTLVSTLIVIMPGVFVAEGLSTVSSAAAKSWLSEIRSILLGYDAATTGNRPPPGPPGISKAQR